MSSVKMLQIGIVAGLLGVAPLVTALAANYSAQEQANLKVVADFYAALDRGDANGDLRQHIRSIAERYLRPDYIQHMEAAQKYGQGREGFIHMLEAMPAMPGPTARGAPPPPKVLALMAEDDLVVRVSARLMPRPDGKGMSTTFIFNMFRVQDGKLAEHWDGASGTPIGPPPTSSPPASDRVHGSDHALASRVE